ncbi:fumarate hydratase, partial [Streptococcus pneumoniae]|uniref:fumarate hydratase n=1 Tax=Streptococcus pneumoniae TaxID=1313 RepID=UPI00122EE6DF
EREQSPAAKDAMAQLLVNSRMCAEGHRPICQDTGIAVVFLKIGMNVRWDATLSVADMVNEGVRAGAIPRGQGRHGPAPGQLPHVRGGTPSHLPGY